MTATMFHTTGLNQHSTPCPRTASSADIDKQFRRPSFNGVGWPRDSPVSQTYDVRNSSTQMILLNNRLKSTRLRGHKPNDDQVISQPNPSRHTTDHPYVNRDFHQRCLNVVSPAFTPEHNLNLGWFNTTQRPPLKFENGSSVNSRRHTSCKARDNTALLWKRPQSRNRFCYSEELLRASSPLMEELNTSGEKKYMMSIARVYSVQNLRLLKQKQYCEIFRREQHSGRYSPTECEKYERYLYGYRNTQFGPGRYNQRAKSAPPMRGHDTSRTGHEYGARSSSRLSAVSKKSTTNKTEADQTSKADVTSDKDQTTSKSDVSSSKDKTSKGPAAAEKQTKRSKSLAVSEKSKTRRSKEKDKTKTSKSKMASKGQKVRADEVKSEADKEKKDNAKETKESDDRPTDMAPLHYPSPREGHGRPYSRLGRKGSLTREEQEDQDDDYDTDFHSDTESTRGTEKHKTKSGEKTTDKTQQASDENTETSDEHTDSLEEKQITPDDKAKEPQTKPYDGRGDEDQEKKPDERNNGQDESYSDDFSGSDNGKQESQKLNRSRSSSSLSTSSTERSTEHSTTEKSSSYETSNLTDDGTTKPPYKHTILTNTTKSSAYEKPNVTVDYKMKSLEEESNVKEDITKPSQEKFNVSDDGTKQHEKSNFSDDDGTKSHEKSNFTDDGTKPHEKSNFTDEDTTKSLHEKSNDTDAGTTKFSSDSSASLTNKDESTIRDESATQNLSFGTGKFSTEEKSQRRGSSEENISLSRQDSVELKDGKSKDVDKIEY